MPTLGDVQDPYDNHSGQTHDACTVPAKCGMFHFNLKS